MNNGSDEYRESIHETVTLNNNNAFIHNSFEIQQNICDDETLDINKTRNYNRLSPHENNIHLFYERSENGYHMPFDTKLGKSGIRNSDPDISSHISYESSLFVEVNGIQRRANSELGIRVVTKPPKSPAAGKKKKSLMNGVFITTEKDKIRNSDCNREIILANNLEKLKENASSYTLYSKEHNKRNDSLDNVKNDKLGFIDNEQGKKIKNNENFSPRRRTVSDYQIVIENEKGFEREDMRKVQSMSAIEQKGFETDHVDDLHNDSHASVGFEELKKELEKLKIKLLLYEKTHGLNNTSRRSSLDGDDNLNIGDNSNWVNKQGIKFHLDELTPEQRANRNRVLINIGGIRHETYRSTLKNIPDTRLSWIAEESAIQSPEYDPVTGEFFFDRHPQVFSHVLNYYRTGNLHVPYDVCGPLFEEELQYWGIDDSQVESCCWLTYRQHRDAQETLKEFEGIEFEKDFDDESEPDLAKYGFAVDDSEAPVDENLTCYQKWQPKIWNFLEDPYSSKHAKIFAYVSMSLIMLSVMLFCLETMPYFKNDTAENVFNILDGCCVAFFTIELALRFIFCPEKILFLKGVMNWIDLLAIMPFFINIVLTNAFQSVGFIESIRVIRVFRIIKLSKHSVGLQILGHTLKASFRELLLLIFFLLIGIVIFSSLVYYCERDVGDTEFTSIPMTFWWAVITMTTVGYGDMVPVTVFGKFVGGLCSISGVLMIALPVPVIVNNFNLYYSHAQARLKLPKKKRRMLCGAANALKGPAMEEFERHLEEEDGSNESIPRINMPRASINSLKSIRSNGSAENNEPNLAALRMKKFGRRDSNMFSGNGSGSTRNGDLSPNMSSNRSNNYASSKRRSLLPTMSSLPEIEH